MPAAGEAVVGGGINQLERGAGAVWGGGPAACLIVGDGVDDVAVCIGECDGLTTIGKAFV